MELKSQTIRPIYTQDQIREINEELDYGFMTLGLIYAKEYERSPRNFINCFLKFNGIRQACAWIVTSAKHDGSFEQALETGKDFSWWAEKQNIEQKWKRVLAEVLLIIYSIVKN